ncbi:MULTISPECIES: hypothetical protein [Vibrio]|uniref:hypothetical protein n=1 Tax=Vibrio TaxID=662 RepID=UPI000B26CBBF|nr:MULTISPECIES: hypothetical protein [Vibrio]
MEKQPNLSLVKERIELTTKVFNLLTAVGKFALVAYALFNVAFNYCTEDQITCT